jgi:hypothetical protein
MPAYSTYVALTGNRDADVAEMTARMARFWPSEDHASRTIRAAREIDEAYEAIAAVTVSADEAADAQDRAAALAWQSPGDKALKDAHDAAKHQMLAALAKERLALRARRLA